METLKLLEILQVDVLFVLFLRHVSHNVVIVSALLRKCQVLGCDVFLLALCMLDLRAGLFLI